MSSERTRRRTCSKDWGSGQPTAVSDGWPLSADDRDAQMMFSSRVARDQAGMYLSNQVTRRVR